MNELPGWWLALSGFFFIANILLMGALVYVLLIVVPSYLRKLQPRVDSIAAKVDAIGHKVEQLATTTTATVETVGSRAKSVAGSVDSIAHTASKQFERFSPFIVGALTAIKLVRALSEVQRGKSVAKATSRESLDDKNGKVEGVKKPAKVDKRTRR